MLLLEQQHWWAVNIKVCDAPGQGTKRNANDAGIIDASDPKKLRCSLEAAADTIVKQDAELQRLRAENAQLKRERPQESLRNDLAAEADALCAEVDRMDANGELQRETLTAERDALCAEVDGMDAEFDIAFD